MLPFIRTLLALTVVCLGGIFATAASATLIDLPVEQANAPIATAEPSDFALRTANAIDVSALPVLYLPSCRCIDAGRVLPDWLTAPAGLIPSGSLTWAGIDEAVIVSLPQRNQESGNGAGDLEFASDEGPNLELLTAIPAPEPPAIVMAGLAIAAGGLVWNQKARGRRNAAKA